MSTLLAQTQSLLAAHSKAVSDALALGHSLGTLATTANERVAQAVTEAQADGSSAVAALAEAIGPNGALTQQLAELHAQWAGTAAPAANAAPAAAPVL